MRVSLIPTDVNTADIFTKVLPNAKFLEHRATLYNMSAKMAERKDSGEA